MFQFDLEEIARKVPPVANDNVPQGGVAGGLNLPTGGGVDVRQALANIHNGNHWHDNARDLIAYCVAKGCPDALIETLAPGLTLPGYTADQTSAELRTLAAGARDKWSIPDPVAEPLQTAPPGDHLRPILLSEFANLPRRQLLIKGLLGIAELSCWYGAPGCGKSFLLMDVAISIARGVYWFNRTVKPGLTVVIAAEGGGGIRKRLDAYCQHHGIDEPARVDIPFAVIPASVDLLSAEGDVSAIIEQVRRTSANVSAPVRLIVIDTLSRALAGGNENSPDDMGRFINNVDRIREETQAHVAIVHHTPHDGKRPRGHSALIGAMDVNVHVEKRQGGNSATVTKNKDDEDGWAIGFNLQSMDVGLDDDGAAITSCVVKQSDEIPKAVRKLPPGAQVALECLHNVLAREGRRVHNRSGIPDGAMCVSENAWRQEFYSRKAGDKLDTKQKAFSRAITDLDEKWKIITHRDGYVWLADREAWRNGGSGQNGT